MLLKRSPRVRAAKQSTNDGFTLVEVLIGILITTLFTLVAMEGMAISAVFKAKARQYSEATNWMQATLEDAKRQAVSLSYNASLCNATASNAGFANSLQAALPTTVANKSFAGQTLTLTPTYTVRNTAPYNVLVINYTVKPSSPSNAKTIATLTTEVIPDAAFQCPPS